MKLIKSTFKFKLLADYDITNFVKNKTKYIKTFAQNDSIETVEIISKGHCQLGDDFYAFNFIKIFKINSSTHSNIDYVVRGRVPLVDDLIIKAFQGRD